VSGARKDGPPSDADDGPFVEPGEVEPKLLLFAPARPAGVSPELEAALATGAVAALVVDAKALPAEERAAALSACGAACRRHGAALLLRNDPAAARSAGADGVHLDEAGQVAAARALLGAHRLVGAGCGRSRHAAMVAGEAGADYVMFGALDRAFAPDDELADLVTWWTELFVLPCAAAGRHTPELAMALAQGGADFVAVAEEALLSPGNGAAELARALQEAAAARTRG
jgi:thiamine-phosphate pyrophosphorylase